MRGDFERQPFVYALTRIMLGDCGNSKGVRSIVSASSISYRLSASPFDPDGAVSGRPIRSRLSRVGGGMSRAARPRRRSPPSSTLRHCVRQYPNGLLQEYSTQGRCEAGNERRRPWRDFRDLKGIVPRMPY